MKNIELMIYTTVFHRLKAAACIWVFALFSERLKINFINPNKRRTQIEAAAFIWGENISFIGKFLLILYVFLNEFH